MQSSMLEPMQINSCKWLSEWIRFITWKLSIKGHRWFSLTLELLMARVSLYIKSWKICLLNVGFQKKRLLLFTMLLTKRLSSNFNVKWMLVRFVFSWLQRKKGEPVFVILRKSWPVVHQCELQSILTSKHSQPLNLKPLRQAIHILNLRWNLITNLSCCLIVVRLGNVILLYLKNVLSKPLKIRKITRRNFLY